MSFRQPKKSLSWTWMDPRSSHDERGECSLLHPGISALLLAAVAILEPGSLPWCSERKGFRPFLSSGFMPKSDPTEILKSYCCERDLGHSFPEVLCQKSEQKSINQRSTWIQFRLAAEAALVTGSSFPDSRCCGEIFIWADE